jgi:hypothetical protein
MTASSPSAVLEMPYGMHRKFAFELQNPKSSLGVPRTKMLAGFPGKENFENHGTHGTHGKEIFFFRVFRVFRGFSIKWNCRQNGCNFERTKRDKSKIQSGNAQNPPLTLPYWLWTLDRGLWTVDFYLRSFLSAFGLTAP